MFHCCFVHSSSTCLPLYVCNMSGDKHFSLKSRWAAVFDSFLFPAHSFFLLVFLFLLCLVLWMFRLHMCFIVASCTHFLHVFRFMYAIRKPTSTSHYNCGGLLYLICTTERMFPRAPSVVLNQSTMEAFAECYTKRPNCLHAWDFYCFVQERERKTVMYLPRVCHRLCLGPFLTNWLL